MARQASVNGGPRVQIHAPIEEGILGNLTEFGNDILTLAQLQARLTAIDLKEATDRALVPLVLGAVGLVLALGCVPVLLYGLAELLAHAAGMHLGWALLLTGSLALLIAGTLAGIAAWGLGRITGGFQRSREELERNLSWIRTVLVHSGRTASSRGRG